MREAQRGAIAPSNNIEDKLIWDQACLENSARLDRREVRFLCLRPLPAELGNETCKSSSRHSRFTGTSSGPVASHPRAHLRSLSLSSNGSGFSGFQPVDAGSNPAGDAILIAPSRITFHRSP